VVAQLWRKFLPLIFYIFVAPGLFFLSRREGQAVWAIPILLVIGLLSWGFIEYLLHRFIFHHDAHSELARQLIYQAHMAHHEDPLAPSKHLASMLLSAPIAVVYWLLCWAITQSVAAASFLFIGMSGGYFIYQWFHFYSHHRKSRIRIFRYLRQYHLLHHHQTPDLRFGVTSPLFDLLFGTFRPVEKRRTVNQS
jgi:dihydroceramide fatty acyl 2-hydroxylase